MKHLSKLIVKDQVDTLNEEEMKLILGGYGTYGGGSSTYRCCCGMGSNTMCFDLSASNRNYALLQISDHCNYGMGGCF